MNIKKELKEFGVKVYTFAFDISSYDEVKRFFKNLPKITKQLDIVINNAAVMHTSSIATTKKEDIKLLSKYFANFNLMRYTFGKTFSQDEAISYIKKNFNFELLTIFFQK